MRIRICLIMSAKHDEADPQPMHCPAWCGCACIRIFDLQEDIEMQKEGTVFFLYLAAISNSASQHLTILRDAFLVAEHEHYRANTALQNYNRAVLRKVIPHRLPHHADYQLF